MGDAQAGAGASTPAGNLNGVTAEESGEGKLKVSSVPTPSLSQVPSAASAIGGGGAASTPASSTAGNGGPAPAERPKKRRRTGKACASCRRRKTRCDGGSPCEACKIGEMSCSYDEPDRRMTAVEYIQSLERKVEELEGLLDRNGLKPSEDGSTSPLSPASVSGKTDLAWSAAKTPKTPPKAAEVGPVIWRSNKSSTSASGDEDVIETMVGTGEYDKNQTSSVERYRGSFAGLSLLRRVHNLCKHVSGVRKNSNAETLQDDFISAFDFGSQDLDLVVPYEAFAMLPSRAEMDHAIDIVVNQACCNMQFVDRPTLEYVANEVYTERVIYMQSQGTPRHSSRKHFALVYAVLAIGRRFECAPSGDAANAQSTRGLRYFRASRTMLDPADCNDLLSLQVLLCMILYTQVSSMMSTCYSYICMAVAAALQMGLFTEIASVELPEWEREARRRVFSCLNMMDTYVTTALGLPRTLRDVRSDHDLPCAKRPSGIADPMAGTYAHAELIQILATAVESNHPVTRPISQKNGFYGVEYSKITATEEQLEAWFSTLSMAQADPSTPEGSRQMRSQLLLRLAYAHVQMVLYRPFLHHALKNMRSSSKISIKAYACGSACINAAMQVVWLAETLESCQIFNEAHWFTSLIMSFTSACLALFVMSNEGDPTLKETEAAAQKMKSLCYRHSAHNPSMQRCYQFLESLRPSEPTPRTERENPFDAWNREVSNAFGEAYRLPEDAGLEAQHLQGSEDLLQALSLPQLRTFVNNRI